MIVVTYKEYNNVIGMVEKTALYDNMAEFISAFDDAKERGNSYIVTGMWGDCIEASR